MTSSDNKYIMWVGPKRGVQLYFLGWSLGELDETPLTQNYFDESW